MKKKEEKSLSHIIREEEVTRAKEEHPFSHLIIYFFFSPLRGRYSNWEKSLALGGTEKLFPPRIGENLHIFKKWNVHLLLLFFVGDSLLLSFSPPPPPGRNWRRRGKGLFYQADFLFSPPLQSNIEQHSAWPRAIECSRRCRRRRSLLLTYGTNEGLQELCCSCCARGGRRVLDPTPKVSSTRLVELWLLTVFFGCRQLIVSTYSAGL